MRRLIEGSIFLGYIRPLCALSLGIIHIAFSNAAPPRCSLLSASIASAQESESASNPTEALHEAIDSLSGEEKEEAQEALEKGEFNNPEHNKKDPSPSPSPSAEPTKEKEEPNTLKDKLDKVNDSENFDELVDLVGAPDTVKKFRQAQKEMKQAGLGDVSMRKDLTHTEDTIAALNRKRDALISAVNRGEMSEDQALQTAALDRLALYKQAVGGKALDNGNYGTDFNFGNPRAQTRNDNNGSYWLNDARKRFVSYLDQSTGILDPSKPLAGSLQGSQMTRSRIANELALLVADHTAASQGPWGSCWTCAANQSALAWRPDDYSKMVNQVIHTGQFTSPYGTGTVQFPSDILAPSKSNLNYNMMQPDNGEQQYTAKIGQYVVGIASGNNAPWDGGVSERAGAGLKAITGVENVPWMEMRPGNNYHLPVNQLGGVNGLIEGINNGTVRVAQYIPFPGHSAENSGFLLSNTEGKLVGFGVNDNSWGQGGENAFLATQANTSKFVFPKGGGTRFGDPRGGGSGPLGGLNSIIGSMRQQQAAQSSLAQQQARQQQSAQQQAAQQQSAQQQAKLQEAQKKQEEDYKKLSTKEKRMLRVYCVRSTVPSGGIPSACKRALTDTTLGAYIPGEKFDLPLPSSDSSIPKVPAPASQSGGGLSGI